MARVNVYLPDELAREWRTSGRANLSQLTQLALRRELAKSDTDLWLRRVTVLRGWEIAHEALVGALQQDRVTVAGDPA